VSLPEDSQHWARWSLSAFLKAMDLVKGDYPLYVEGDERTTRLDVNFVEVRVDGPDIDELCKNYFLLQCQLNVLINHKMSVTDLYSPERILGQFQTGFTNTVNVFRVGNGPDDDQSFLGCYQLIGPLDTSKFGVVNKDLRVVQLMLEARYKMQLSF
jgi:hypothetical protein